MTGALRIPELSRRDRFIKRVVAERCVHAGVAPGGDTVAGLVGVTSPKCPGRRTALLWSSRADAERWTPVLDPSAQVEQVPLAVLAGDLADALARGRMLAGLDWNTEPVEVELEIADLLARLHLEALEAFIASLKASRRIWVLEDPDGPAVMPAPGNVAQLLLPVWTERAHAERHIAGEWADTVALEIPLDSFVALTLPWLVEQGWRLAPAPWGGREITADGGEAGSCSSASRGALGPEIGPQELAARLAPLVAAA